MGCADIIVKHQRQYGPVTPSVNGRLRNAPHPHIRTVRPTTRRTGIIRCRVPHPRRLGRDADALRRSTRARRLGPEPGHRLRLEPGQPGDVQLRPAKPRPGRAPGSSPARLHPDRHRLLRPLRLAAIRRPVGLHRRVPADVQREQLPVLLQLVRLHEGHPRQRRGGVRRADGVVRREPLRLGPAPRLRHRAVRRRRHDRRPARRLSGRLRRRRDRLRPAGAVCDHAVDGFVVPDG